MSRVDFFTSLPAVRANESTIAQESKRSFSADLEKLMSAIDHDIVDAEKATVAGVRGEAELHEVALKLEKADISMRLMMKARNKVVEAYQEIMRMPV